MSLHKVTQRSKTLRYLRVFFKDLLRKGEKMPLGCIRLWTGKSRKQGFLMLNLPDKEQAITVKDKSLYGNPVNIFAGSKAFKQ